MDAKTLNTTALAFMGDAVYEQFIREKVILSGKVPGGRADMQHKAAVKYVCAGAQAAAVKAMIDSGFLREEEIALVKRARNHKVGTKARSADMVTYKWATAFEALLGYLYLDGRSERLKEVLEKAYE